LRFVINGILFSKNDPSFVKNISPIMFGERRERPPEINLTIGVQGLGPIFDS
jgi:hypothetical protein